MSEKEIEDAQEYMNSIAIGLVSGQHVGCVGIIKNLLTALKEAEAELAKWTRKHDDADLQALREQANQSSLAAKQAYINGLEHKVRHLEGERDKTYFDMVRYFDQLADEREKVTELEQEALRFPTLSEFSNLQEDHERKKERVRELEKELADIKADPSIVKLVVEDWPETPDY